MKKLLVTLLTLAVIFTTVFAASSVAFAGVKADADYLSFNAVEASSVTLTKNGSPNAIYLQVSINGDEWTDYTIGTKVTLNAGDTAYFKAKNTNNTFSTSISNFYKFVMTGKIVADGNVMSLVDSTCTSTVIPCNFCFYQLFNYCAALIEAPDVPATTLKASCYYNMFRNCTSLVETPELPAMVLTESCYANMFQACTSLTKVVGLPAMTLAKNCYNLMFADCTALVEAPALPATDIAICSYTKMFERCTSLEAPADISHLTKTNSRSCSNMYSKCTALKVYTTPQEGYSREWTIPANLKGVNWSSTMLTGTTGNFVGNPACNVTYYIKDLTVKEEPIVDPVTDPEPEEDVLGYDGYEVYRQNGNSGNYKFITDKTGEWYFDSSIYTGKGNLYEVRFYKVVEGKKVFTETSIVNLHNEDSSKYDK